MNKKTQIDSSIIEGMKFESTKSQEDNIKNINIKNKPLLSIRNLYTSFPSKLSPQGSNNMSNNNDAHVNPVQIVHDHLNLDIDEDEIVILAGGSGAGKTVLLKKILGLLPISNPPYHKGEIYWQDKLINQDSKEEMEMFLYQCGVQFQSGALISYLTVGENIMLPLLYTAEMDKKTAAELAMSKMLLVGLNEGDFNKSISDLSGGMIKRVSLARAIALDPAILIMDEPTSGLDTVSSHEYEELMRTLNQGLNLTILMITHDIRLLKTLATKVGVLYDKKLYVGQYKDLAQDERFEQLIRI